MADRSRFSRAVFASKSTVLPSYFHEGTTKVDSHLTRLMECEEEREEKCEVVVKRISIYKTPLGKAPRKASAAQQRARSSRTTVDHRFLIVDVSRVQHPTRGELPGFLIRAEKSGLNKDQNFAGVMVNIVPFIMEGEDAQEHFVRDLNLPIQLKKLVDILGAHDPDYDVLRDNCWKYADNTFRALDDTREATTGSMEVRRQDQSQRPANQGSLDPLIMPIDQITYAAEVTIIVGAVGVLTYCAYEGLKLLMPREDGEDEEEENKVPAKARS